MAVLDGDPSAVELPTSVKVTAGRAAVMWARVGDARMDGNIAFCVAGDPEASCDE